MSTYDMPRGRNTFVRHKRQTDFRTGASGAAATETNCYSFEPSRSRSLEGDDVLGAAGLHNTLDARPAAPSFEDASISASYPLDLIQVGWRLAELFGAPTTTGTGPYVHTFTSHAAVIPVTTFEHQLKANSFRVIEGAVATGLRIGAGSAPGFRAFSMDYLARRVRPVTTASVFTSPNVIGLNNRIANFKSRVLIDAVAAGSLIDAEMTLANGIGSDRYVGDEYLSEAWREGFDASFDLTARFSNDVLTSLGDLTTGQVPDAHSLTVEFAVSVSSALVFNFPVVRFEPTGVPVSNGGAMTVRLRGRAEVGAASPLLTAQLTNAIAGGTYA